MHQLSKLSLLVLVVPGHNIEIINVWEDPNSSESVMQRIRRATRTLELVRRAQLSMTDVRVQFKLWAVAELGCSLSPGGGPTLEACQALEASLLSFPPKVACNLRFHGAPEDGGQFYRRRAGRPEFWSPTITSAFPKLNQRGFLTLPCSRLKLIYPYDRKLIVSTL